jgi:hypothetical protein
MPKEYTIEQVWKLFEKLPKDLQEAIFSVETADSIYNICEKNEISEVSRVAKIVGFILLGLLSPNELQETLEKELKLEPKVAKKASQEIDRFILYSVRGGLTALYGAEISPPSAEPGITPPKKKKPATKKPVSPRKDIYRELLEEE